jgi:hypothetical protein
MLDPYRQRNGSFIKYQLPVSASFKPRIEIKKGILDLDLLYKSIGKDLEKRVIPDCIRIRDWKKPWL